MLPYISQSKGIQKKTKLSISLDRYCKVSYSLSLLYGRLKATKYIVIKLETICFYLK